MNKLGVQPSPDQKTVDPTEYRLEKSHPPLHDAPKFETLIIGTGFAGLCMAIQLKQRGRPFLILERGNDVGGTWRDNTYPGCGCDIPSNLYSFSFERNPDWSRTFPTQPELLNYLKRCTDKHQLRSRIRFNTEVREAIYDEQRHLWHVYTQTGETFTTRVLISALGPLSRPAYPDIRGIDRFQGRSFHSARWDHSYDLRGKRVAVIGTGASAIQFIPQIAPHVSQLYVFQRTPPWILPKKDKTTPSWKRFLFRYIPGYQQTHREWLYWLHEFRAFGVAKKNPLLLKIAERIARRHLEKNINDPTLRSALTPDYLIGCKRILISNDYYPVFNHPHVKLITEGISEIHQRSILTSDGQERGVDALIYGTGFIYPSVITPLRILGRQGVDLNDTWREQAKAYLGVTVARYPNYFILAGPNSGVGYTSLLLMIEAQVHYILECLDLMKEQGTSEIEVREEAQKEFNDDLQLHMRRTVWVSGCQSRYLDKNGNNTTLWPGFSCHYRLRTRRVNSQHYQLRSNVPCPL